MDTHPVHDLDAVADYFENKLTITDWVSVGLVKWSNNATTEVANGGVCSTYTIQMQTQFITDYQVSEPPFAMMLYILLRLIQLVVLTRAPHHLSQRPFPLP